MIAFIIIIIIISFIFGIILFKEISEINKKHKQLQDQNKLLQTSKNNYENYQFLIKQQQKTIDSLLKEKEKLINETQQIGKNFEEYKKLIDNNYIKYKIDAENSFEHYMDLIDSCYEEKEKGFISKIENIENKQKQAENKLTQIKNIYNAAIEAHLREKEQQEKHIFYQLQLTKKQILDISNLEKWKKELYDPSIVAKIIWSSFIMKSATDLCNRVVGSNVICGIYKITNQITKEIYIGQSVNITDRFKQHIKCGLGIDASPTNKLYNNMQEYGVWNFSFEILQKCSRDKLNEKERFWIDMYQSNKIGMNLTKGNK